uniref:Uncharacterized protein n=1 Tax=Aegilops tauschii subsp. strangulata TaxID=200361 RepID=A0A453HKE7_AEGTS
PNTLPLQQAVLCGYLEKAGPLWFRVVECTTLYIFNSVCSSIIYVFVNFVVLNGYSRNHFSSPISVLICLDDTRIFCEEQCTIIVLFTFIYLSIRSALVICQDFNYHGFFC